MTRAQKDFKKITDLSAEDLRSLHGKNSAGMVPNQWRLMPLHGDDHDLVTEWAIFQLDDEDLDSGDIIPVADCLPYWNGLDIVRSHNAAFGFYKGQ